MLLADAIGLGYAAEKSWLIANRLTGDAAGTMAHPRKSARSVSNEAASSELAVPYIGELSVQANLPYDIFLQPRRQER
jgi:hypothetical protein